MLLHPAVPRARLIEPIAVGRHDARQFDVAKAGGARHVPHAVSTGARAAHPPAESRDVRMSDRHGRRVGDVAGWQGGAASQAGFFGWRVDDHIQAIAATTKNPAQEVASVDHVALVVSPATFVRLPVFGRPNIALQALTTETEYLDAGFLEGAEVHGSRGQDVGVNASG